MLLKTARAPISQFMSTDKSIAFRDLPSKTAARRSIAMQPDHWYMDIWAVSAYEKFGLNDNADGFEKEELKKSFPTFIGSWACLDHQNHDEALTVGRNVDAVYTPDDYVRIAMGVNRVKGEKRHPGLENAVQGGLITDTSMGCICRESVCTLSKCANIAADPSQYCDHIRYHRGETIVSSETNWEPIIAGELNRGVVFFEDSIITSSEGADNNAKILAKLASHYNPTPSGYSIPADKLYKAFKEIQASASPEVRGALALVLEHLNRTI